jgi:hypothetical protein
MPSAEVLAGRPTGAPAGSDEEGLQSDAEGGDGRERMLVEGLGEMGQREPGRTIRDQLRWRAQATEGSSNGGLSVEKSGLSGLLCQLGFVQLLIVS